MAQWPYTTQRWQRLRRHKLQARPLCEACLQHGKIEGATVVDHKIPINASGEPFPLLDELASLCERCHNAKTRAEQQGKEIWLHKGCDYFGRPHDPNHPWNRERNLKPPVIRYKTNDPPR
jgi:5-methylcytosine-specific restriction enzyme A